MKKKKLLTPQRARPHTLFPRAGIDSVLSNGPAADHPIELI